MIERKILVYMDSGFLQIDFDYDKGILDQVKQHDFHNSMSGIERLRTLIATTVIPREN